MFDDDKDGASALLQERYPFAPAEITKRRYGLVGSTRDFVRDGFIDRYSGERLLFPPVLRVLSSVLPEAFPYHPNRKTDVTHPAYWEIAATVDHLVPVTRGGIDEQSNLITTSMAHNFAKMNWTLLAKLTATAPRREARRKNTQRHRISLYDRLHRQVMTHGFHLMPHEIHIMTEPSKKVIVPVRSASAC